MREEVTKFTEAYRDSFGRGPSAIAEFYSDILTMDVQPLGLNSALAAVQCAYKGACEEMLWKATFSYNLYRRDGVWKILVQTMHDS
jgi:hypothetical protein